MPGLGPPRYADGIVSPTGIAGLTLGGGIGWLNGKHALAYDNLLSADIVTADARLLTASAREHADVFWAVRGGGANVGVVTSFEYRLHPIGPVLGGGVAWPIDRAKRVLAFYGEGDPAGQRSEPSNSVLGGDAFRHLVRLRHRVIHAREIIRARSGAEAARTRPASTWRTSRTTRPRSASVRRSGSPPGALLMDERREKE